MKNKFVFWLPVLFCASGLFAEVSLKIVQPYENATLPFVKRSFVFGSVWPAKATLTLNGQRVETYSNGGFLAMIPFEAGLFKIEAVASDGLSVATMTRVLNVEPP